MDTGGVHEGGNIGSYNSLGQAAEGIVGAVTNGVARDTDEIVKVKRPAVYCCNGHSTRGRMTGPDNHQVVRLPDQLRWRAGLHRRRGVGRRGRHDLCASCREYALEVGRNACELHHGDPAGRAVRFGRLAILRDKTVREY